MARELLEHAKQGFARHGDIDTLHVSQPLGSKPDERFYIIGTQLAEERAGVLGVDARDTEGPPKGFERR